MESFFNFNQSLGELSFLVSVGETEFPVTGHTILGIFMLIVASYLRRRAVTGFENWEIATAVIGPTLGSLPPALNIAASGCFGLLISWIAWPLVLLFLIGGADQVLLQGGILTLVGQIFVS